MINDDVKISVIIPVYNRYDGLKRALESLNKQKYKNFEVIIVDDGSSENYTDLIVYYNGLLDLKYIKIENSGGPSLPRNIGVSHSKYEWISFLDSDDWWMDKRISIINEKIKKNPHVDIFYHKLQVLKSEKSFFSIIKRNIGHRVEKNFSTYLMLVDNPIPNSSSVVRKIFFNQVGGYNVTINCAEDLDLWLRLAKIKANFKFINKVLGYYYIGSDNITKNSVMLASMTGKVLIKNLPDFCDISRDMVLSRIEYILGSAYLANKEYSKAILSFNKAYNLANLILKIKKNIKKVRCKYEV